VTNAAKKSRQARKEKTENRYILDEQVGYLMRLANQRHTAIFHENMSNRLTPTQFSALVRLAEIGSSSQNELGRLTSMDVATIKGVVDRLSVRNLIELAEDGNDRRRISISLSDQGRALVGGVQSLGLAVSAQTLAPLSPNERKTLIQLLRKITA
jgi:DNA-binding MarR family transcriptional regulator